MRIPTDKWAEIDEPQKIPACGCRENDNVYSIEKDGEVGATIGVVLAEKDWRGRLVRSHTCEAYVLMHLNTCPHASGANVLMHLNTCPHESNAYVLMHLNTCPHASDAYVLMHLNTCPHASGAHVLMHVCRLQ